mmetsp:Transcript_9991/g.37262  ORF Transcript_9991/g.37262 Transcript_9991/m.37262 type:complete len:116 (-) Transcript_9991:6102-6449(-)
MIHVQLGERDATPFPQCMCQVHQHISVHYSRRRQPPSHTGVHSHTSLEPPFQLTHRYRMTHELHFHDHHAYTHVSSAKVASVSEEAGSLEIATSYMPQSDKSSYAGSCVTSVSTT